MHVRQAGTGLRWLPPPSTQIASRAANAASHAAACKRPRDGATSDALLAPPRAICSASEPSRRLHARGPRGRTPAQAEPPAPLFDRASPAARPRPSPPPPAVRALAAKASSRRALREERRAAAGSRVRLRAAAPPPRGKATPLPGAGRGGSGGEAPRRSLEAGRVEGGGGRGRPLPLLARRPAGGASTQPTPRARRSRAACPTAG